jgi:hypothetical protein
LEASLGTYVEMLGPRRRSRIFDVSSQGVRVCFIEIGTGAYLELIQGKGLSSPVDRYYRTGFYHVCFLVDDLAGTIAALDRRFRPLTSFPSEAFDGRKCQFLVTPESHLIELAEMAPGDFRSFFESSAV